MSCEFTVAFWDASGYTLETADLGSLPVFLPQQASLVVLESLGQLNRGHLIWPKEKNLNPIHNLGIRYKQGSLTAWRVRCWTPACRNGVLIISSDDQVQQDEPDSAEGLSIIKSNASRCIVRWCLILCHYYPAPTPHPTVPWYPGTEVMQIKLYHQRPKQFCCGTTSSVETG